MEPESRKIFPLPFEIPAYEGEYAVTISFHLKEDKPWAKAGHEVAFGQVVVADEACGGTGEYGDRKSRFCIRNRERREEALYPDSRQTEFRGSGNGLEALFLSRMVSYLTDMAEKNFWCGVQDRISGVRRLITMKETICRADTASGSSRAFT